MQASTWSSSWVKSIRKKNSNSQFLPICFTDRQIDFYLSESFPYQLAEPALAGSNDANPQTLDGELLFLQIDFDRLEVRILG